MSISTASRPGVAFPDTSWLDTDARPTFDPARTPLGGLAGRRGWVDVIGDMQAPVKLHAAGCATSACGRHVLLLDGRVSGLLANRPVSTAQLLQALQREGLDTVLGRIDGAFALAWWNGDREELTLVRDRAGQRALYYGWWEGRFIVAPDAAGVFAASSRRAPVDRQALALYLRHGYVPAPHCLHAGMYKLLPGSYLRLGLGAMTAGSTRHQPGVDQVRWWDAFQVQRSVAGTLAGMDAGNAVDRLQCDVADAVNRLADVPQAGVLLSGSVGSSVIAAVAQAQSSRPLPTLAVDFTDSTHGERDQRPWLARRLRTEHERIVCHDHTARDLVMELATVWSEPVADPGQLPMLLAARAMQGRCRTLLTGAGDDALFFGDAGQARALANMRWFGTLPQRLRDQAARHQPQCGMQDQRSPLPRLIAEIGGNGIGHHYLMRTARWRQPAQLLASASIPRTAYGEADMLAACSPEDAVQYLAFAMELSNGILANVGEAARSVGLEPLAPLLGRSVIETAWALPHWLKKVGVEQKWVLKALLCRYLPDSLVFGPRRGVGPPIARWLRGTLRPWAEALLCPVAMQAAGLRDPAPVMRMWAAFLDGRQGLHRQLWTVLVYLDWFRHNHRG